MALFTFKKKQKDDVPPFDMPPIPNSGPQNFQNQGQQGYPQQQPQFNQGYSQQPQGFDPGYSPQQNFPPAQQFTPAPQYQQPQSQEGYSQGDERIEEIAEAIIDEKWQELVKDVKKVIEWKNVMETRLDQMDQQVKDVKSSVDNMQKAIFGKISDYDKSLTNVGTEIKAMEKVFQQILPNLTESINRLDRVSKDAVKK